MTSDGADIHLKLDAAEAAALDAWAARQDPPPRRDEAVRQLLAMALADRRQKPRPADG